MKAIYKPQRRVEFELNSWVFHRWEDIGVYKTPRAAYNRLYKEKEYPTQVTVEYVTDSAWLRINFEEDKENDYGE